MPQLPQTSQTAPAEAPRPEETPSRPKAPWLRLVHETEAKHDHARRGTGSVDEPQVVAAPAEVQSRPRSSSLRQALSAERSELLSARRQGQLRPEDACYLESIELELDRLDEAELRAEDQRDAPLLDRLSKMIAELRAFRDKVPRRA